MLMNRTGNQPILYRFHTLPQERSLAHQILQRHGRTALDHFKLWPDKSYFFNPTRDCFIAYRVAANMAVVLGDPVDAVGKVEDTLRQFQQFCDKQGWSVALHQTQPIWLSVYRSLGFRKLKLGGALCGLSSCHGFAKPGSCLEPHHRGECHGTQSVANGTHGMKQADVSPRNRRRNFPCACDLHADSKNTIAN
ncbi:MAG: DUF2156 domain-containing protein [Acidobacteria bacterium]|nr:DUF2156 domain-containing protein [Acidobacteriota bacterium]